MKTLKELVKKIFKIEECECEVISDIFEPQDYTEVSLKCGKCRNTSKSLFIGNIVNQNKFKCLSCKQEQDKKSARISPKEEKKE